MSKKTWTADSVTEKIKQIVVEQLGVDEHEVVPDATFRDDLGTDSLDDVEIVMACEEEFDIEIPDQDVDQCATVGSAINYIKKRLHITN